MATFIPLIAGAVGAVGSLKEGSDRQAQAERQAQLDQMEARNAEQVGLTQEATTRRQSREFLGRQAAAFAQAGVGPGSSTDVQKQSAINAELDALNVRYRGQLTKYGYDYSAQSDLAEGNAAKTASYFNAGGALLKGVSNYYGK